MKVIIRKATYEGVKPVIEEILDAFPLEWEGKKVLVKPNMLGPWKAEKGVTTHPSIIEAITGYLRERKAEVWVGDNPGILGYADNEKSARISGILEASRGFFVNLGKDPVNIEIKSKYIEKITISRQILDCDILISVPKFKTHTLTMITGAVKNSYGFIVGAEKVFLHARAAALLKFSEATVDVYELRPPDISIMDAVVCMDGKGPSGGGLIEAGKILASDNAVSLDAVMTHMMGVKPRDIPMLRIAGERGLGEIDISKIEIDGTLDVIEGFNMPRTFAGGIIGSLMNRLVFPRLRAKPSFDPGRCTRCKACYEVCPVKAISWDDGPVLDKKKCISCFCCMESCLFDAIGLRGVLYRLRDALSSRVTGTPG